MVSRTFEAMRSAWLAIAAATAAGCATSLHVISAASVAAGDRAPVFTLAASDGHGVALADELARGPVAIVFYRGFW